VGLRGSYSFFACGRVCVTGLVVLLAAGASAQMSAPPDPLDFSGPDPTVRFKDISIEQHLDALVPLDLEFVDESGAAVRIGDYLGDRPAILALVYYECPMLCTRIETVLSAMKFKVGEDFDVITVSIDPGETPEMAGRKKIAHLASLGEPGAESGWHFLTGEAENIELLADTVGFGYVYDGWIINNANEPSGIESQRMNAYRYAWKKRSIPPRPSARPSPISAAIGPTAIPMPLRRTRLPGNFTSVLFTLISVPCRRFRLRRILRKLPNLCRKHLRRRTLTQLKYAQVRRNRPPVLR